MMKWLSLILLSMVIASSAGCISTPSMGGGLGAKTKEIIKETQGSMSPFYFAGFFLILGGAAYGVFFKDFRFLFIGLGVAMVPPLVIMFLAPFAIWVGWIIVAAGLMGLAFVGYRVYDYIKDQEAERAKIENP